MVGIRLVMHLLTLWKGYNRIVPPTRDVPRGVNNVSNIIRERIDVGNSKSNGSSIDLHFRKGA